MRKVILTQSQSPGDILVFTRAVADLKKTFPDWQIDVRTPCPEIWENSPRLTPLKESDVGVQVYNIKYGRHGVPYMTVHESGWSGIHFIEALIQELEAQLMVKIQRRSLRPEIWISDLEKTWTNQVEAIFCYAGPFWLLNAGIKPDNELKQYHRWQEVVSLFNDHFQGSVRLVQIGHKDHIHPKLDGVYDLVGKTDLRQFIRLSWWAHGSVGPISFQMHLSGALQQPAVVVAGGKEPIRWELYPNHRYLATNGCLACCAYDGCWLGGNKGKCKDQMPDGTPRCFALIKPYQIVDAIKMYYGGGMLHTGVRGK